MSVPEVFHYAITLDPRVLLILASLLSMATAFVTSRFASGHVKALTLLALSIVTSAVAGWQENGATFVVGDVAWTALGLFLTGVLLHFGLLKPVGVTGSDGVIARAVPGGVGGDSGASPTAIRRQE
jgi:hypothetical protein